MTRDVSDGLKAYLLGFTRLRLDLENQTGKIDW